MIIESSQNSLIKKVNSLKSKKNRDELGLFTVEGLRFVEEITDDYKVCEYLISQDFESKYSDKLPYFSSKSKVFTLTNSLFKETSDTKTPQGILAVCLKKQYELDNILTLANPFLLIINNLQDPGNLGTIIRVADASGVDCIIISKNTVDLYNPKVLRATMGSIFHLPIINEVDINEYILKLKQNHINILATHLNAAINFYSTDLTKPTAIIVGNEANGLTDDISAKADTLVKIPMIGKAESLNVSMATAIVLYEGVRQRLLNK